MVKLSAQSPPKKEAIKVEEGLLRRSGPSGERERQSESNENLKIQHLKVWNCHKIVKKKKMLEKDSLTFLFSASNLKFLWAPQKVDCER